MLAQKLSELRPGASITIVEAGRSLFDLENRFQYRDRMAKYGENPWPGDFIEGQAAEGGISRTMAAGGQALHWGGTCNRFSEEDLRLKSMYGLYVDWPLEWTELEKFYCEAERRLGVSGEPSPFPGDKRSEPYLMKPIPLTWSLDRLKEWGNKSGIPSKLLRRQRTPWPTMAVQRAFVGIFRRLADLSYASLFPGSSSALRYSRPSGPIAVTCVMYSLDFAQRKWKVSPGRTTTLPGGYDSSLSWSNRFLRPR